MTFTTLTDEEKKELYRLNRFYWKEARRCERAKAYLAGCVMLGSALETLLILMINCHSDEAEQIALLRHSSPALYHVFLFSPQTAAAQCEAAGYVLEDSGTGPPALPVRGRRSKRRMGKISFRDRVA